MPGQTNAQIYFPLLPRQLLQEFLPTLFMRKFQDGHIGAIDVADAFLTVKQHEATLVTACDSLGIF